SFKDRRRGTDNDVDATDTQGRERGRQHEAGITGGPMNKTLVERAVAVRAHDRDAWLEVRRVIVRVGTGEIVDAAGDDCHAVTAADEVSGELVVSGAPGFGGRRKGLVDDQDVHTSGTASLCCEADRAT